MGLLSQVAAAKVGVAGAGWRESPDDVKTDASRCCCQRSVDFWAAAPARVEARATRVRILAVVNRRERLCRGISIGEDREVGSIDFT
jgi:hypothetical protein